jgi:phage FluMu gp28-like protein
MDDDTLKNFARQLDVDSDEVLDRWQGRPDLIIDDIFRVEDIDTGQPRDLELFDVQRKVVHAYFYGDAGTLNAYKGRRIGYSFVVVACFLLEGLFYPNSFYPIVSRSLSQSKDRISDLTTLIENAKIEIPTEKTNTDEVELWNGTRFMAYSADSDTSRGGDSARAVLMDEMAFIEHEEQARRAFGAFLSLGENRKMVEISTPNTRNDLFMKNHRKGSPDGENGVISIKQPTFANAEEIDIHEPLYEQEVEPVRPELNIDQIETERMSDPEGFAQEYLCRPVVNEYRFFDEDSVDRAMQRALRDDYATGLTAPKENKRRVMGVDIGINRDDTVLSIMDHAENRRQQRKLIVADDDVLRQAGVRDPDRGNANHIAQLIAYVYTEMDVDLVVMDKGGVGQTFQRIIERKLGRSVIGFDFSDGEGLENMMGDTNAALRNNKMVLVHNDRLRDEMCAIVKEKNKEHTRASFSGKENSESGKDDTAMATALSAFPPQLSEGHATSPSYKPQEDVVETPKTVSTKDDAKPDGNYNPSYGATSVARGTRSRKNRYRSRRTR